MQNIKVVYFYTVEVFKDNVGKQDFFAVISPHSSEQNAVKQLQIHHFVLKRKDPRGHV